MKSFPKDYSPIIALGVGLFLLILFFFSYIQTEILTSFNSSEFDIARVCKVALNSDFKSFKLIKFEKYKSSARAYCLYDNPQKNVAIDLIIKDNIWKIENTKFIQKDNAFVWPVYY
jgi:hypothetical protein